MIPGCGVSYWGRYLGGPEFTSQSYCLPWETRKSKWIKVNTCRNQNRDVKRTAGPNMRCLCNDAKKSSGRECRLLVSQLSWWHSCTVSALRKARPWHPHQQGGSVVSCLLCWLSRRITDGSALAQTWSYGSPLKQASRGFPSSGLWARI